jgi:hypothetical protein
MWAVRRKARGATVSEKGEGRHGGSTKKDVKKEVEKCFLLQKTRPARPVPSTWREHNAKIIITLCLFFVCQPVLPEKNRYCQQICFNKTATIKKAVTINNDLFPATVQPGAHNNSANTATLSTIITRPPCRQSSATDGGH